MLIFLRTSMHDLVDQLKPVQGEFVIDKPGKGTLRAAAFPSYLAHDLLQEHSMRPNCIRSLLMLLFHI
jgi:hypothetical protein